MCFNLFKKKKQQQTPLWQPETQMPELYGGEQKSNVHCEQHSSVGAQANAPEAHDYNFMLAIENECADEEYREILEPTEEHLQEAIGVLDISVNNFFTLNSGTPINNCTLLQCHGREAGDDFDAEIIRQEIDKKGKPILCAYHCNLTQTQLLQAMKDFMQHRTPDLDGGSDWYFLMEL